MRLPRFTSLIVVGSALTSVAAAQGVTTLVLEGDVIPGAGTVTGIANIAVNNNGDTFVEVTTNGPANANQAILKNGNLFLMEGQALTSPAGATCGTFDSLSANISGNGAFNLSMGGQTAATDTGVFWNDQLVLQEGTISTSAAFTANTPYVGFDEVRINDNDQILLMGRVNDPNIGANNLDACVVILNTDGQGNLTGENVLWKADDNAGSNVFPATQFSTQAHTYDFNNAGQVIHQVFMATGSGANDVAVYLDQTNLAEEASPSPVAGRNWSTLSAAAVGLNNNGDWVLRAALDGNSIDNELLVKNNVKFVQEGDILAGTGGWALEKFASSPADISDTGDVAWFGNWDDPNTSMDTGIFINMDLKVQEGVTQIGNNTVKALRGTADGFRFAPSGGFLIFEAELDNGLEGAFYISAGEPGTPTCFGDGTGVVCPCGNFGPPGAGCSNSTGMGATLAGTGSPSIGSNSIGFNVQGLAPFKPALLVSNPSQQTVPYGEGVSCVGSFSTQHGVQWANGGGNVQWAAGSLQNPNWIPGQDTFFQVFYRDNLGTCGMSSYNSSQAYKVGFIP